METFDAGWLALREPIDHRSRSRALARRLADWWEVGSRSRVLDLGAGTGSNLRYLSPILGGRQQWTLIDHDPALLDQVHAPRSAGTVTTAVADLAAEGLHPVSEHELITASALLDLVSSRWLQRLVDECVTAGSAALFSLTYDGRIEWHAGKDEEPAPGHPLDEHVRTAVNEHQCQDKGLGPALGPNAGPVAEGMFRDRDYRVWTASTPWRLGPDEADLAEALLRGWVQAAVEQRPGEADRVRAWGREKEQLLQRGEFRLTVGHVDLLALPKARPGS